MEMKPITITGKLYFSQSLHKKPMPPWITNEEDSRYEINLCNLDDATVKRLQTELNVKVKNKGDADKYERGNFIVIKSKFPFVVEDKDGNKLQGEQIGNGSVAELSIKSREHALSKMHGYSPQAIGGRTRPHIVVSELVEVIEDSEDISL